MTCSAAGWVEAEREGMLGLMMPTFSRAILGMVFPSQRWWSRATLVRMLSCGVMMLVASRRPPMPVSQRTRSHCV